MIDTKSMTATTDGVEGIFRMGEVLQAKKDLDYALEKFEEVVYETEKIVFMNPSARIEIQWAVLSLGNMSDIYTEKEDWKKALALRQIQTEFLQTMTNSSKTTNNENSDDENTFLEITTIGRQYNSLFRKAHAAIEMPCKPPPEDPQELARKFIEAKKKDEEAEVNNVIKKINEVVKAKEDEINNSFFKKNMQIVFDHPILFVLFVILVGVAIFLIYGLMRARSASIKREKIAKAEAYMRSKGMDIDDIIKLKNKKKRTKQKKTNKDYVHDL